MKPRDFCHAGLHKFKQVAVRAVRFSRHFSNCSFGEAIGFAEPYDLLGASGAKFVGGNKFRAVTDVFPI